MLLIDGEHEKRHHGRDHDQSSHAGTHGVLGYKKQRHADERAQTEAKDLTLGQVKQELGFDPCQILGNRHICHVKICGIIPHCGIKRGEKHLRLFRICIAQAAQCIGIGRLCGRCLPA